jgi:hypothetical protein
VGDGMCDSRAGIITTQQDSLTGRAIASAFID